MTPKRRGRAAHCNGHNPRHFLYQLTCDEFALLVARAEGRCERCGEVGKKLMIEHDHTVGIWSVRGLACHRCNMVISASERGDRDLDDLTRSYLANPFHAMIPAAHPGLRPIRHRWTLHPSPCRDQRITSRTPVTELIGPSAAAAILGFDRAGIADMVATGRLIYGGHQDAPVFRRVVIERLAAGRTTED